MPSKENYAPFTGTYKPFIKTQRFDIFHHRVVRNPKLGHPREMFTAWYRADDVPRPVCEVILYPNPYGVYVEWVHVCEEHRRYGIATEVMAALEAKFGTLDMSGATEAGEAFVEAYREAYPEKKKQPARKKSRKKSRK